MAGSRNVALPQGSAVSLGNGPFVLQAWNLPIEYSIDETPTDWFTLAPFKSQRIRSAEAVWARCSAGDSNATIASIVLPSGSASSQALNALSIAAPVFMASAAVGTVISAIDGQTSGSTLALADSHSGAVAFSGGNLIVGPMPPASSGSFTITLQETLVIANNSPRSTVLTLIMADVIVSPSGNDSNAGTPAAPIATLHKARQLIAAGLAASGGQARNFVALFRNGTYFQSATEIFALADTAAAGFTVTYEAYPGEAATISGGQVLSGFTVQSNGNWTLAIPSVADGAWYFGEIWVNSQRAKWPIRPAPGNDWLHVASQVVSSGSAAGDLFTPDCYGDAASIIANSIASPALNTDRFGFNPGELDASWTNLTDVRIEMTEAGGAFLHHMIPLKSISGATATMACHTLGNLIDVGQPWKRLNVYEDLGTSGQTGEMYLNRSTGVLTYVPRPGETPANSTVIAPVLNELIEVTSGTAYNPASSNLAGNVIFRGLTFAHTNSKSIQRGGYIGGDGVKFMTPLGAVSTMAASGVLIDQCAFTHLGEAGVIFGPGTVFSTLQNSLGSDLGAGLVISSGPVRATNSGALTSPIYVWPGNRPQGDPQMGDDAAYTVTKNITIFNNGLSDYGRTIFYVAGILQDRGSNNVITHNEVSGGPSWGVHIGSLPVPSGLHVVDEDPYTFNNYVGYNHIHDLGDGGDSVACDFGGLYVLGKHAGSGAQPALTIEFNKVHDVYSSKWAIDQSGRLGYNGVLLYIDNRASYVTVRNSLFYNGSNIDILINSGLFNTIENSIFAGSFVSGSVYVGGGGHASEHTAVVLNSGVYSDGSPDNSDSSLVFRKNICVWNGAGGPAEPFNQSDGMIAANSSFDFNLYFQLGKAISMFTQATSFSTWKGTYGQDAHSLINQDPLFTNPSAGDFSLQPGSPAIALGFIPFDLSIAGRV